MTSLTPRPAGLGLDARAIALTLAAASLASSAPSAWAVPADAAPSSAAVLAELQKQIDALRQSYDARIKALEDQLAAAKEASAPVGNATQASANAFNPQVAVILSGNHASIQRDPATSYLSGFVPSGSEASARGFNLGESEVTLSANIDPWFYGAITLSVSPDDSISAEEAYVQTTALPNGLKLKAGRFYAGVGYLNEQHAHTWDFVDAPLAYRAFLGGQYKQEGVQARWLLPTDQFVELSGELGKGASFPGTDRNRNGAGSVVLAAHTGGDWGDSSTWRAGASWMQNQAQNRTWDTADGITHAFTGTSRLWALDGVWKWAPNGNATRTNFKLQGEYFRRVEAGTAMAGYDATDPTAGLSEAYRTAQSGWYLQGLYQFTPGWRVGLRHDHLDSGADLPQPQRNSLMVDWSLSEFSRWRVQLNDDRSRGGLSDRQLFLQYQMSLGAHGAHSY